MQRYTQGFQPTRILLGLLSLCLLGSPMMPAKAQAAEPAVPAGRAEPTPEPQMPDMEQLEFGKLLVTQRCSNCHEIAEGEKRFAAPLHHLFGRMPGSIEGYTFSINMKNIKTPWTPSTLDNWLAQTTFDTPDIRMRHVGITKVDQRTALIGYLKTLPGNSEPTGKN